MNAKPKINLKMKKLPFWPGPMGGGPLQHLRAFLGLSRRRLGLDDVLRLIDSRQIRWAWDIARRGARRPEVRIWRDSLVACLAREEGVKPPPMENLSLDQVIEAILRRAAALSRRAASISFYELQRRLLCCRTHLHGLIDDGELCRVGQPRQGEMPMVLYQSAFEFLKRRSMSA